MFTVLSRVLGFVRDMAFAYFLGAGGNVGWLLPPRLHPSEALDPAKRDVVMIGIALGRTPVHVVHGGFETP